MNDKPLPTVRLTLGDDFETMQRHSSWHFLTTRDYLLEVDELAADKPIVFTYLRPGGSFTLPPALHTGLSLYDGHITDVAISPHLHYLSQSEAFALADELCHVVDKAGWKHDHEYNSFTQARHTYDDPKIDSDFTIWIRTWRCHEDDELTLKLERHQKQGERLPSGTIVDKDHYTVTVSLNNGELLKRYDAENDRKNLAGHFRVGERKIPVHVEPAKP